MKTTNLLTTVLLFSFFSLQACGSGQNEDQTSENQNEPKEQELTAFEMEHGIGPVTETVDFGEIDKKLAAHGEDIFSMKCEMCHNMEGRMVGPELGNVLDRRSPEFVMNMILNPGGMTKEHPIGKELLQEYMTAMPFQNVSKDDARAIIEYLRSQQKHDDETLTEN